MAEGSGAGKRPFWLHQLAEYILGLALVAVGVQSPTPLMPCLVAAVIIVNAAVTKAPFAAFHLIGRRLHRAIDVGVIAFQIVAAIQPWVSVEGTTRMIMLAIAAVHAFIWWQSSYIEKIRRNAAAPDPAAVPTSTIPSGQPAASAPSGRSADLGRTAGRIVGSGVNTVRQMKANRQQPPE